MKLNQSGTAKTLVGGLFFTSKTSSPLSAHWAAGNQKYRYTSGHKNTHWTQNIMHYCNYRPNYEISLQMRAKCEPSASQCKSDVRQICAMCESSASQVCAMCAPNASHAQVNESQMKAEIKSDRNWMRAKWAPDESIIREGQRYHSWPENGHLRIQ